MKYGIMLDIRSKLISKLMETVGMIRESAHSLLMMYTKKFVLFQSHPETQKSTNNCGFSFETFAQSCGEKSPSNNTSRSGFEYNLLMLDPIHEDCFIEDSSKSCYPAKYFSASNTSLHTDDRFQVTDCSLTEDATPEESLSIAWSRNHHRF